MNSIRPLATVILLAVIGIGLYMVINTSEPIPPDEAAGVMLEIPEIEGDLTNLIDEGVPSPDDASPTVPPFATGDALADPPTWAPPATDDTAITPSEQPGPIVTGQLPPGPAAGQLPDANDTAVPAGGAGLSHDGGKDPFSTQIERQAEGSVRPQEVTNPYASTTPSGGQVWGDIPAARMAENVAAAPPIAASEPPTASPASPYSVARQAIEQTLLQGNLSQALLMLTQFYGDPQLTPTEREELDTLLGQLAGTVIYSTQHSLEPAYRVQPGETLADVAARFQVSPQLLAKINGLSDTSAVPPGTELKVVRGPFHAIYDQQGLRLVLDGRYAGRFAAGGPGAWPADTWTVEQKVPGQAAAVPPAGSGKQIFLAPSDPATGTTAAAIVTGAPAPDETRPAVYVSAKDMDDLYDILTVGSRVTIRR